MNHSLQSHEPLMTTMNVTHNQTVDRDQTTRQHESSHDDGSKMNLDMALNRVGGFGLFQVIVTIGIAILRNAGSGLYYLFAYLTLPQLYECRADPTLDYTTCSAAEDICPAIQQGSMVDFRVDTSYEYYLENWQQEKGLMCMTSSQVHFAAIMYFICFGVGGLLTFPIMDKIGRRKTHYIFSTFHILAQGVTIYTSGFTVTVVCFGVMGFLMVKNSLCYAWLFEFVTKEKKSAANTSLHVLEFATACVAGLYFLFVSQDWKPLFNGMFGIAVCAYILITLVCPESPKWLLLQGRTPEAIKVLNYIAVINRSKNRISADTEFVEAAIAQNIEGKKDHPMNQSVLHQVSMLSMHATKLVATRESPAKKSVFGQFALFVMIMMSIQVQYYSMYYLCTVIGGNIFLNCIMLGVGESIAGFVSGYLLSKFKDSKVFIFVNAVSVISIVAFYQVPRGFPQYALFFTTIFGMAGQFNSIYVLVEMRMPPENTAATIVLITTIGTLVAATAPMIASAGYPTSMWILAILGTSNICLTLMLAEPGTFLPRAVTLSKNVTLLRLENLENVINESVYCPTRFATSFSKTYTEHQLGVERPRLNETNMDPDTCKEGDGEETRADRSYSRVIRNWDWDMHDKDAAKMIQDYQQETGLDVIKE